MMGLGATTQRTVTAKTRKRCRVCHRMVEVGDLAVLTDDRYESARIQDFGRSYKRGAWHLTHASCAEHRSETD